MLTRKIKIHQAFRLDPENIKKLRQSAQKDPTTYRSQATIVDSALHHFFSLNKTQQKEILKRYLTRDL